MSKKPVALQSSDTDRRRTSAQFAVSSEEQSTLAFNPDMRPASSNLEAWLEPFTQRVLDEDRKRENLTRSRRQSDEQRFRCAIHALVCNLITLRLSGDGLRLSVPLSNEALKGGIKRYRSPVFGEHIPRMLAVFKSWNLLEEIQRGYRVQSGPKQLSLFRPTQAFFDSLPSDVGQWGDVQCGEPCEVIVLKSTKQQSDEDGGEDTAPLKDYVDTDVTVAMRHRVRKRNARLRDMPLSLVETDGPGFVPVNLGQRYLRRIFSNGCWDQGGRLYGGFWETMARAQRFRHLRIDGERIANVDYGQLYLRLAYAEEGLQAPLDEDLYQWPEMVLQRDKAKMLVNAMLFARQPLQRIPEKLRGRFAKGQLATERDAVLKRHSKIAGSFHRGLGHHLSFFESELLLDVLERLDGLGVYALPVHDSVLVPVSLAAKAKAVMEAAFNQRFGGLAVPVSVKDSEQN